SGQATEYRANQHDQGHPCLVEAQRVREFFDRIWSVSIHLSISGRVGALGCFKESGRIVELRHQAIDRIHGSISHLRPPPLPPSTQAAAYAFRRLRSLA